MPISDETRVFHFEEFQLQETPIALLRHGVPIRLRHQCLDLLHLFALAAGEPVTRDQIRHHLWNGRNNVDHETAINTTVSTLRHALGDDINHPRFIETLPRNGYRFVASVTIETCPLCWRARLYLLLGRFRRLLTR